MEENKELQDDQCMDSADNSRSGGEEENSESEDSQSDDNEEDMAEINQLNEEVR